MSKIGLFAARRSVPFACLILASWIGCTKLDATKPLPAEPDIVRTERQAMTSPGEMKSPRFRHTATLLPDGSVLIAGGASEADPNAIGLGANALGSAEIYDPWSGTTSAAADLHEPRWGHTATRLRDGSVLIAGGFSAEGEAYRAVELYDPRLGQFVNVGPMRAARGMHTATLLGDGRVLVIGGATERTLSVVVRTAEIYDPETRSFAPTASPNSATVPHAAALLEDGRVYLVWPALRLEERFDPSDETFSEPVRLETDVAVDIGVTRVDDGSLVMLGVVGNMTDPAQFPSLAVLYPEGGVAASTASNLVLTDTGWGLSAAVARTTRSRFGIVEGGGIGATTSPSGPRFAAQSAAETLRAGAVSFPSIGALADRLGAARAWHTATTLVDNSVLLTGGWASNVLSTTERLGTGGDWTVGTTSVLVSPGSSVVVLPSAEVLVTGGTPVIRPDPNAPNPPTRSGHTSILLPSGRVLLAGGFTNSSEDPEELFDPATATSEPTSYRLRARASGLALGDGRALFAGPDAVELCDPLTNTVRTVALPAPLDCPKPSLLRMPNGRGLVVGATSAFEVDARSGSATPPVELSAAHCGAALGLLRDGTVLIVGGDREGRPSTNVEVYDSASRRSTAQQSLPSPVKAPRLLPWLDRLVLVGEEGTWFVFDFLTRVFTSSTSSGGGGMTGMGGRPGGPGGPTGTLPSIPAASTVTLLPDGRYLSHSTNIGGFTNVFTAAIGRYLDEGTWCRGENQPCLTPLPRGVPERVRMGDDVTLEVEFSTTWLEGGSGTTSSSSSSSPVPVWFPAVGGWPSIGTFLDWSETGARWRVPSTPFPGLGFLFISVNGSLRPLRPVEIQASRQAATCDLSGECETGYCVDGVCCDAPCDGVCQACTQAGKGSGDDGVCGPLEAGRTDAVCNVELETCGETGECDGQGACAVFPDGTECAPGSSCSEGACTRIRPPDDSGIPDSGTPDSGEPTPPLPTCDGDHTVNIADRSEDCSPYRCRLQTDTCLRRCSTSRDCVDGLACSAQGECQPPLVPNNSRGCGCRVAGESATESSYWLYALAAALGGARFGRRRRLPGRVAGANGAPPGVT